MECRSTKHHPMRCDASTLFRAGGEVGPEIKLVNPSFKVFSVLIEGPLSYRIIHISFVIHVFYFSPPPRLCQLPESNWCQ